ncbi:MAG: carbohydrate ABC transporter permease [Chloroflexi bacterium]|nr:carbohydrate ABC transporter permease [Chloroflexota bacterium]
MNRAHVRPATAVPIRRTVRVDAILSRATGYLVVLALAALMLMPLSWMVSTSLKELHDVYTYPPSWIPKTVVWSNYPTALTTFPFLKYLGNTLIITATTVIGTLVSSCLVAYGFARLPAPGRGFLFILLLSTMMLPGQVTIIPLFILYTKLGWVNTYLPLIVPSWFAAGAFYVFLLRQFFLTIPNELSDAARVDGAGELVILTRVILPLSRPALLTVIVFSFMQHWNDFWGPLIFLQKEDTYTLSLGLAMFLTSIGSGMGRQWNLMMAASFVVMVPIIALFFFAQRYFIEGIALTGLKG